MNFIMRDPRLLARIINLTHRFGCRYSSLRAHGHGPTYEASIELHGPDDAVRRLSRQIHKLISDDKEFTL